MDLTLSKEAVEALIKVAGSMNSLQSYLLWFGIVAVLVAIGVLILGYKVFNVTSEINRQTSILKDDALKMCEVSKAAKEKAEKERDALLKTVQELNVSDDVKNKIDEISLRISKLETEKEADAYATKMAAAYAGVPDYYDKIYKEAKEYYVTQSKESVMAFQRVREKIDEPIRPDTPALSELVGPPYLTAERQRAMINKILGKEQ